MKGPSETIPPDKQPAHAAEASVQVLPEAGEEAIQAEEEKESVEEVDLIESYGWMVDEEEFNQQVCDEIKEEEYLEQCFEDMWKEEDESWVSFESQPETNGLPCDFDVGFEKLLLDDGGVQSMAGPQDGDLINQSGPDSDDPSSHSER